MHYCFQKCDLIMIRNLLWEGVIEMKKRLFICTMALVVGISCNPVSALAAPKQMPDGTVFDPQYYAQMYPDVVAAIGTDENALYNHYVQFGKAEGRKPYADATAPQQAANQAAAGVPAASPVTNKILALKSSYPDGATWTSTSSYTTQSTYSGMRSTATACQGFCYLVQDAVFGKQNYKRHKTGISDYVRKQVGKGNSYRMIQGNSTFLPIKMSYSSNDPEWAQVMAAEKDHMWIPIYADGRRIYDGTDAKINADFEAIWKSLQVGDMICDTNHAAIVLTKSDTGVTVVEGNYVLNGAPGAVKWGRTISKETMRVALYDVYSCQW
jgi:hypothetical protein